MIASFSNIFWQQKRARRWLLFGYVSLILFFVTLAYQFLFIEFQTSALPTKLAAAPTQQSIERYQILLQASPNNANLYAYLGLAYLQRVREVGNVSYYELAEATLEQALALEANQPHALIGLGTLALARHDFEAALVWGKKAAEANPFADEPLGIQVDAYVELGRYDEAVATLQEMMDLRPNLAAYSRVSYLRELHGDVDGAIGAMRHAVALGSPGSEETLWAQAQLGNLYFNQGEWEVAEQIYQEALHAQPDYVTALAGIGRVQAARGELDAAIATYLPLVERYPSPAFVATLGELYLVNGQPDQAQRQFELVQQIQRLNAAAEMNVDLELALFLAEHSQDPAATVEQAEAAYQLRPSLYAADVLAWSYYQNGDYAKAWEYSQEALQLNTQDAMLHFHAGMIAQALGNEGDAQTHLRTALEINPAFSIIHAADVQSLLLR